MSDATGPAEVSCVIPLPRLTDPQDTLLRAAFRELMATSASVTTRRLGELCGGIDVREIEVEIARLAEAGRIAWDGEAVTGALGLTLDATQHELTIGTARWHTWCVIDALGILGALRESGTVRSMVPGTGASVEICFAAGTPVAGDLRHVVLVPEQQLGASVIDTWCPSVNFFPHTDAAEQWARAAGVRGRPVDLFVATAEATRRWRERLES